MTTPGSSRSPVSRRGGVLGAVGAAVAALVGAAFLAGTSQAREPATSAQAPSRAACAPSLAPPVRSPAYAKTPWPTEHADVWRTHAGATGLPANVGRVRLATASATLPQEPVWGYVGTGGKLYVIGGSPYLLNMFTELMLGASTDRIPTLTARTLLASTRVTPYVAQIDARTMKVDVLPLTGGGAINYTGGLLVHANGYLYAVVRAVLYKIDRRTFSIVASTPLPLAPDGSGRPNPATTYNGIVATRDGDLILKGWASTGGGDAPGRLLRVDPDDLSIGADVVSTAISSARMAIVDAGGTEYVYFPGGTQSVRFVVTPTGFVLDPAWTATYLSSGDTQASSDVFMGGGVVFASNTSPQATTPMRVLAQGAAPGAALRSATAFRGDEAGWNFFMMVGDPYRSGIAAVQSQASGRVAGYRACGGGTSVRKLWENDDITSSAGHGRQLPGRPPLHRRPPLLAAAVPALPRGARPADGPRARPRPGEGHQAVDGPNLRRARCRLLRGDPDRPAPWLRHPRHGRPALTAPGGRVTVVRGPQMPSLGGATHWLNSELGPASWPATSSSSTSGQLTRINWLRQEPYVRAWARALRDDGPVVIGVHTPEFPFEHDPRLGVVMSA